MANNSSAALDYARAIDLCQVSTENPPTPSRVWGVISMQLLLANGTGVPASNSRSIRTSFGTGNVPRAGSAMSVLSTGNAAATGQTNPAFAEFQPGQDESTSSAFPSDWFAAHGSVVPVWPGCPALNGTVAHDPVMLKVRMRVPTNVHSFSVSARFFSADYAEWVCSPYNDQFVVLLDSSYAGVNANPSDKNIAMYRSPLGALYPVNANLAHGDTGLFQACVNGATGCEPGSGAIPGTTSSCTSTAGLQATGFDKADPGKCNNNSLFGGGTAWLSLRGNVVPGKKIELRFIIWDTSDGLVDSLVLLDNFQWSTETTTPGAFIDN